MPTEWMIVAAVVILVIGVTLGARVFGAKKNTTP